MRPTPAASWHDAVNRLAGDAFVRGFGIALLVELALYVTPVMTPAARETFGRY